MIYFIHTNAMKPFSNYTTFYKVVKKTFQIFTTISQKSIVVKVSFQRDINSIRIRSLAKYDWLKEKLFQQGFCLMKQNLHSLLAFWKFNKEVSIWHQR